MRRPVVSETVRRRRRIVFSLVGLLLATLVALHGGRAATQRGRDRTVRLATVEELPTSPKRWALVIGVDEYTDEQITGLRGGANDARTLAAALIAHAGFPSDQVIVLATGESGSRLPTRTNILRYLSNLSGNVPKDGLLLVSFSGHGIERDGQAFLLPSDATAADSVKLLESTAVSVSTIHEWIRESGVGQVMVLLDACRNDPTAGRADSTNALSAAYTRGFDFDIANREVQAFATIYATSVGARAYEYVEKRQGYFTWAVVEGLSGAAADAKGRVTLAGLVTFVQEVVPKRVTVDYGPGKQQRPLAFIGGYRADDLILAVTTAQEVVTVVSAPVAVPVIVDPKAGELALWKAIESSRDAADFVDYLKRYPTGTYEGAARAKLRQLRTAEVEPAPAQPLPAASLQASDTAVDLGDGVRIEMVLVPAGGFEMGGGYGETDERPRRWVTISKPYLVGKYEVTQRQWKAVMGSNPSKFMGNDNLPVEQVTWDECNEFIRRLNAKTGMAFRLPTEEEWEYACRAGTLGTWAGSMDSIGWYYENAGRSPLSDSNWDSSAARSNGNQTHPVGQKQPNGWGLYDMHGNVMEWCADLYDAGYPSRGSRRVPMDPAKGSFRTYRGGGWISRAANCRSADRSGYAPTTRYSFLGLRLARSS